MAAEEMEADSAALVFVYGSLKRGQPNHGELEGCPAEGEAELRGLALYDLGPFPMAIPSQEPGSRLQGELYRVENQQLARLDRFEGAPRLYERQRWRLADGRPVWVYVGRPQQVRHVRRIACGCWQGRARALAALLALTAAAGVGVSPAATRGDLRAQCRAWSAAHGREQVQIANQIGAEQLLTKTHRLAEPTADDSVSLYSWSDLQRLCRRL
jgi:gamma-glutamylcyclotransferase (GGCT)/AIG2-like uncharacterized protein YtfP